MSEDIPDVPACNRRRFSSRISVASRLSSCLPFPPHTPEPGDSQDTPELGDSPDTPESDSDISTAAGSSPATSATSSPLLEPEEPDELQMLSPLEALRLRPRNYADMSVVQLREELLGHEQSDDFAAGWEREELIAVLEEMDRVFLSALGDFEL